MDKLQPVIKHRFWILAALVPPLCIFGYYSANGAMKEATAAREAALDGLSIPDGTGPNPTWTDADKGGLQVINAEYKAAVDAEFVRVWDEQQERMTWPPSMQRYVPDTYRGEFPNEAGFTYNDEYADLIAALHESVEPITADRRGKGFSGKVWIDQKLIPRHEFGVLSVESDKIWDAQEDLWYLQLLFDAIRNVNRSSENAAKAAIRRVYKVDLLGGTGESSVKASAGPSGMPGMPGMHDAAMPMMEMQIGSSNQGTRSTGGLSAPRVGFDPAEEFGSDVKQSSQSSSSSGDPAMEMPPMMTAGNRGAASQERIRYIKLDESAKYRERGFYLSVLIDQKKIADFLVELSNADWPIRIVRFHVGPNPETPGASSGMMDQFAPMYSSAPMPAMEAGPTFDAFDPGAFDAYADPTTAGAQIGPAPLVTTEQMAGLFTHPDLVQLDVAGVITFYNPPSEELLAAVQAETDSTASELTTEPAAAADTPASTDDSADLSEPGAASESSSAVPGAAEIPGAAPVPDSVPAPGSSDVESSTESADEQPDGSDTSPAESEAPEENSGTEPPE